MKIHDIREMKTEELKHQLDEEQKNLIDLRFQHQLKQLTNTSKLKLVKRDVARIKTVLREREFEALKETSKEKGAAE
ncbi:MAG TPA: 50S ribosomal protein L29 [Ignavibacteriaceae bacterium]|nr:50S ribosomal protein L29 [Ignavibacteriaceae bacterium]